MDGAGEGGIFGFQNMKQIYVGNITLTGHIFHMTDFCAGWPNNSDHIIYGATTDIAAT